MAGTVPNCCGCISLRTGSIVIASVYTAGNVIGLLWMIIVYTTASDVVKSSSSTSDFESAYGGRSYSSGGQDEKLSESDKGVIMSVVNSFFAIFLVLMLADIAVQIVLIAGVMKRNVCMILTWVIVHSILAGFAAVGVFFGFLAMVSGAPGGALSFFRNLFSLALGVYFLMVVNSHRQEIMESRQPVTPAGVNVAFSPVFVSGGDGAYMKGNAPGYPTQPYPLAQPLYPAFPEHQQSAYPPPYTTNDPSKA